MRSAIEYAWFIYFSFSGCVELDEDDNIPLKNSKEFRERMIEEYIASDYFKYAWKLIAHSVLHAGFGLTGLSRAITEYLVTEDAHSCLPYLIEEDIPDLDLRGPLKQVN